MKDLYGNLKLFGFTEQLNALTNGTIAPPVHVRVKPINACNHRCWFCAYRAESLDLGSEMSLKDRIPKEKMFEIVEDFIEMGVKAVTFSGGGEPLIYPHIVETITKLGEGGIKVASLTNGAFLKGAVADAMAKYATWVRVSIDSWDSESCMKHRGVKAEEFDKILTNMREFKKRDSKCVLGVSFIITNYNADHLLDITKVFKEIGVNHVKFSPCITSNQAEENNRYHAPIHKKVVQNLAEASKLSDEYFTVVNHYHQLDETFKNDFTSCPFLQMLTVIGADCNVYTCQDKAYTPSGLLGSIKQRRFKDFWLSDEHRDKIHAFNPSVTCQHHCVASEKNRLMAQYLKLDKEHAAFV